MPLLHCELEIKTSFGVGLQTTAGFRLILFGIPLGLYFSLSYTRNFDSGREVEKADKQRKEEKSIRERWGKAEEAEGPREGRTSLPPPPALEDGLALECLPPACGPAHSRAAGPRIGCFCPAQASESDLSPAAEPFLPFCCSCQAPCLL